MRPETALAVMVAAACLTAQGLHGTRGQPDGAHGRPVRRRDDDGDCRGQPAAGGAGGRADPGAWRQRHRRRHRGQRHDRPDGAHWQRHRRRPVHPLLRSEDGHGPWVERERMGADGAHARAAGLEGDDEDAAARHLLRHGAGRRGRLGRHALALRHQAVRRNPGPGHLLRGAGVPRVGGDCRRLGAIGADARRAPELAEDVPD